MLIAVIIISLSILIFIHELGHFLAAKFFKVPVSEFGIGFPPRLFGRKLGGTVYSINVLPFGGFVKIEGDDDGPADDERSFAGIAAWKKVVILSAGVAMNIFLGWIVLSAIFMAGTPQYLMIAEVATGSPAEAAGIMEGDIIIKTEYFSEGEHRIITDPVTAEGFIDLVSLAGEDPVTLSIVREKESLEVVLSGRLNPPPGEGSLGIAISEIGFFKRPFLSSLKEGLLATALTLKLVVVGFYQIITGFFIDPDIIRNVAGPVGIFGIAMRTGELGLVFLFQLMAFISINLAVINLAPFPALDGGRILFLAIEKIRGAAISLKTQHVFNLIGFTILIIFMIAVTIKDILFPV